MTATEGAAIAAALSAVATLVLAGLTWWYAKSIAKILVAMREQSEVAIVAAKVSAWSALATHRGVTTRLTKEPVSELHRLALELEKLSTPQ